MKTDGMECRNVECRHHDPLMEFSCSLGDPPVIETCWDREVDGDPQLWVMRNLRDEIRAARRKFPDREKLFTALVEEVGELANAMLENKPRREVEREALQVACVAVRILEERDSDFDNWSMAAHKVKP